MGTLVQALASTHAFTFRDPQEWDGFRAQIAAGYERRYKVAPAENPGLATESPAENEARYRVIANALVKLREELQQLRPDALLLIGDDQNENFRPDYLLPQIAIYTGPDFKVKGRHGADDRLYRSHPELARAILERGVADGFDIAMCSGFSENALTSHAHYEILQHVVGDSGIPVVILFINALHIPSVPPARCFALGQSLGRAISERPAGERVALYASGGLSHFTGGFPWPHYDGPFAFGDISQGFDRAFMDWIRTGQGARSAALTSRDLLHHGDVEMRSWITLLGAVGEVPTNWAVYEPFYRGMMGMAAASWTL